MLDHPEKLIKAQELFLIWQKILKSLAEISLVITSLHIYRLHENFLKKKAYTGRNNEEEQTGAPNGIYSGQRTQCEEYNLWLSTRCNDCIVLS